MFIGSLFVIYLNIANCSFSSYVQSPIDASFKELNPFYTTKLAHLYSYNQPTIQPSKNPIVYPAIPRTNHPNILITSQPAIIGTIEISNCPINKGVWERGYAPSYDNCLCACCVCLWCDIFVIHELPCVEFIMLK